VLLEEVKLAFVLGVPGTGEERGIAYPLAMRENCAELVGGRHSRVGVHKGRSTVEMGGLPDVKPKRKSRPT